MMKYIKDGINRELKQQKLDCNKQLFFPEYLFKLDDSNLLETEDNFAVLLFLEEVVCVTSVSLFTQASFIKFSSTDHICDSANV